MNSMYSISRSSCQDRLNRVQLENHHEDQWTICFLSCNSVSDRVRAEVAREKEAEPTTPLDFHFQTRLHVHESLHYNCFFDEAALTLPTSLRGQKESKERKPHPFRDFLFSAYLQAQLQQNTCTCPVLSCPSNSLPFIRLPSSEKNEATSTSSVAVFRGCSSEYDHICCAVDASASPFHLQRLRTHKFCIFVA